MTVLSVKEILEGKGGSNQGPHDSTITRAFRVVTNNPFDTPIDIAPSLPVRWGDLLAQNPAFICRGEDYDFQNKGPGRLVVVVTFTFRTEAIDQEEQERQSKPNPLDRRARVTVRGQRYGELTIFDRNGNVKRNSAGEIYEPKEVDAERWMVHVKKNFIDIPDWAFTYQRKLNDAPVTVKGRSLATETLKFGDIVIPELQIENGYEFYPIEFDLEYKRSGWKDKRVDAGFYYLDGSNNLKRILDSDDQPVEVEQWLDGAGTPLRDTIANPQPGDESYNEFDDYETADFSALPLSES